MIIKQPQISLINNYTVEVHVDAMNCKNHILIFGRWYWDDSSWRSFINKSSLNKKTTLDLKNKIWRLDEILEPSLE